MVGQGIESVDILLPHFQVQLDISARPIASLLTADWLRDRFK
jgi:hypothetical protein